LASKGTSLLMLESIVVLVFIYCACI
jgi:hypothetical protein